MNDAAQAMKVDPFIETVECLRRALDDAERLLTRCESLRSYKRMLEIDVARAAPVALYMVGTPQAPLGRAGLAVSFPAPDVLERINSQLATAEAGVDAIRMVIDTADSDLRAALLQFSRP